jgi:hypothetical protein
MLKLALATVAAATLLAVVLEASADRQRGTDPTLNVRMIPFAVERAGKGLGPDCVGATSSSPGVPPSTKVTLAPLDNDYVTIGDEILFEIVVERLSDTPIALALTRDADLAPSCRRAEDAVRTYFGLAARQRGRPVLSPWVPACMDHAGWLEQRCPSVEAERLRVRVPATVVIDPQRPLFEEPQRVDVSAIISLEEGGVLRASEMSSNSQTIHVSRRW